MGALAALVVVAAGFAALTPAGPAAAAATTEVKEVTAPLRVESKTKETPIEGGTSYYCGVGVFVSFNDIAGWTPDKVTAVYFGAPSSEPIGAAPYDDDASLNGLVFPPVGGSHQTQIGDFSYAQGGSPTVVTEICPQMKERVEGFFGATATVTYTREVVDVSRKCAKAQAKFEKAVAKVRTIQRKVGNLNKQINQLNKDIKSATNAGDMREARRLTKQLDSKKSAVSNQKDKLREAKKERAQAGAAAARACRD